MTALPPDILQEKYDQEKVARFIPMTVRKRKFVLDSIVREIERRRFRSLDPAKEEDVKKIEAVVFDINPELSERTRREYTRTCIAIWRKRNDSRS